MSQDWENWDSLAAAYHQLVGSSQDALRMELLYPTLHNLLGQVSGQRILDIGCGTGHIAKKMAKAGAKVFAFDTPKMVALAQQSTEPVPITYIAHDTTQPFPYENNFFDIITSTLVIMDIAAPQLVLNESGRTLKEGGKLIISIPHPCFTAPVGRFRRGILGRIHRKYAHFQVNNYFNEQPSTKSLFGKNGPLTSYYPKTLTTYSQLFKKAGLIIDSMYEPAPTRAFQQKHPSFFQADHIPIFLIYVLRKSGERRTES